MKKISEENVQAVLNYIAGSRSDFKSGDIFQLIMALNNLEDVEEVKKDDTD